MTASHVCRADGPDGRIELVSDGKETGAIIVGGRSGPAELKIAEVLANRIARRTGCRLPIVKEKDFSEQNSGGGANIVIGNPSGNSLADRLCRRFGKSVPSQESVGPGGFAVYAAKDGNNGWIIATGADERGTVCAVGKLLRRIDFAQGRASLPGMEFVEKIDPGDVMEIQQQKPPQWGNAFMDAPAELLREYIEDMALWGSTDFVTLGFLWTLDNPFDPGTGAESRERLKKITDLAVYAGQLGMKVGYYVYPNTVYRDEVHLRKLGGKFRYRQDVCPSVPESRKVLLQDRENIFRHAKESGVELAYTVNSAYDFGGCDCPKCEPWIATHIELSREVHAIAKKYFPDIKVYFTTWGYKPAERELLLDWLAREKPDWVAGVINRPALDLQPPYKSVGWQTIFACGAREVYGRMGSDPLPLFLPGKIEEFHGRGVRCIITYSEGIYDDINNAVVAGACRKPLGFNVRETLEEYCHDKFGTDWNDSAALAGLMLDNFRHEKAGQFNASLRIESPELVLARLEEIEGRMSDWAKVDWRWQIFKTRAELEALDQKGEWLPELQRVLACAAKQDGERLSASVAEAVALLRAAGTISPQDVMQWEDDAGRITSRLYNGLYRTPHRYPAHGQFRLRPKLLSLAPSAAARLEELNKISNQEQKREALRNFLAELKALDRYVSRGGGRPVLRPKNAATITGANLTGGKALPDSAESRSLVSLFKGGARAIGSASGKHDTLRCRFEFETGEEPLGGPVKLTVSGSNRSAGDAAVAIRLNGRTVFSGPSRFAKDVFSDLSCSIPQEWILDGTNELEIQNLASAGDGDILVEGVMLNAR